MVYIVEREFAERVERKIEILEIEYNRIVKQGVVLEDRLQEAACEIYRLREVMEKVADALYDKGDHECWAALRNALWQQGEKE